MEPANLSNDLLALTATDDTLLRSKILIIDDEEVNVRLLKRILQHSGFENLSSTIDWRLTFGLFQDVRPDLILTG
jgi:PleD family two-component response regulator